jgi:hypothetical protein
LEGPYDAIVCNFSLLGQDLAPLLSALKTALASDGSLLIQTVHPWIACGDAPYVEGWRDENFAAFGNEKWQPMPWYFRTLQAWMELVHTSGFQVHRLLEPLDPETNLPLSLLLVLQRAPL